MPKMCPFTFTSGMVGKVMGKGLPRDCQEEKCEWWTGTECAGSSHRQELQKRDVNECVC